MHYNYLCKQNICQSQKNRKKDKFVHSWISSPEIAYCSKTMIWWLLYEESVGMFCVLCRKHDTCNLQNKSKVFNKTPSVRYKQSVILDHANTDQHKTAVTLELTSRTSVFQKSFDERQAVADENLKAACFALYWLMKEELPNCKFSSLIMLVEKMGHPAIKHFKYTGAGTERERLY